MAERLGENARVRLHATVSVAVGNFPPVQFQGDIEGVLRGHVEPGMWNVQLNPFEIEVPEESLRLA